MMHQERKERAIALIRGKMEALICPNCGSPDLERLNALEYRCASCRTTSRLADNSKVLVIVSGSLCPECGFLNESGMKQCAECGAQLVKYCLACGAQTPLAGQHCPGCGKTEFTGTLFSLTLKPGSRDYDLKETIRLLKSLYPDLGLKDAKNLCEKESVITAEIPLAQARSLQQQFARRGAVVEVNAPPLTLDPLLRGYALRLE